MATSARKTRGGAKGFARLQESFERRFDHFRDGYQELLSTVVARRGRFIAGFLVAAVASLGVLLPWLGRDFLTGIKSGEIDMHVRSPIGLRLEEASKVAALVAYIWALSH